MRIRKSGITIEQIFETGGLEQNLDASGDGGAANADERLGEDVLAGDWLCRASRATDANDGYGVAIDADGHVCANEGSKAPQEFCSGRHARSRGGVAASVLRESRRGSSKDGEESELHCGRWDVIAELVCSTGDPLCIWASLYTGEIF